MAFVDRPLYAGTFNFLDRGQRKGKTSIHFKIGGGVSEATARATMATLVSQLQALSNARLTRSILRRGSDNAALPPNPTPGPYRRIVDRGIIKLQPVLPNTPVPILLPMPIATDFLADNVTINPADTNIAALLTWLQGHIIDYAGQALVNYLSGERKEERPRALPAGVKMIE